MVRILKLILIYIFSNILLGYTAILRHWWFLHFYISRLQLYLMCCLPISSFIKKIFLLPVSYMFPVNLNVWLTCPPCRPYTSFHTLHMGRSPCAYPKRVGGGERHRDRKRGKLKCKAAESRRIQVWNIILLSSPLKNVPIVIRIVCCSPSFSFSCPVHFHNKLPASQWHQWKRSN